MGASGSIVKNVICFPFRVLATPAVAVYDLCKGDSNWSGVKEVWGVSSEQRQRDISTDYSSSAASSSTQSQKQEKEKSALEAEQRINEKKEKEKLEADRLAKIEADRLAKIEADRLAKIEADRLAKIEADRLAKIEADRLAKIEADRLAKIEADRLAKIEADRLAKIEADRLAKIEADRLAKIEADRLAKIEADRLAKIEADRLAKIEADRKTKIIEETRNLIRIKEEEKDALEAKISEKLLKKQVIQNTVKKSNYLGNESKNDFFKNLNLFSDQNMDEEEKLSLDLNEQNVSSDLSTTDNISNNNDFSNSSDDEILSNDEESIETASLVKYAFIYSEHINFISSTKKYDLEKKEDLQEIFVEKLSHIFRDQNNNHLKNHVIWLKDIFDRDVTVLVQKEENEFHLEFIENFTESKNLYDDIKIRLLSFKNKNIKTINVFWGINNTKHENTDFKKLFGAIKRNFEKSIKKSSEEGFSWSSRELSDESKKLEEEYLQEIYQIISKGKDINQEIKEYLSYYGEGSLSLVSKTSHLENLILSKDPGLKNLLIKYVNNYYDATYLSDLLIENLVDYLPQVKENSYVIKNILKIFRKFFTYELSEVREINYEKFFKSLSEIFSSEQKNLNLTKEYIVLIENILERYIKEYQEGLVSKFDKEYIDENLSILAKKILFTLSKTSPEYIKIVSIIKEFDKPIPIQSSSEISLEDIINYFPNEEEHKKISNQYSAENSLYYMNKILSILAFQLKNSEESNIDSHFKANIRNFVKKLEIILPELGLNQKIFQILTSLNKFEIDLDHISKNIIFSLEEKILPNVEFVEFVLAYLVNTSSDYDIARSIEHLLDKKIKTKKEDNIYIFANLLSIKTKFIEKLDQLKLNNMISEISKEIGLSSSANDLEARFKILTYFSDKLEVSDQLLKFAALLVKEFRFVEKFVKNLSVENQKKIEDFQDNIHTKLVNFSQGESNLEFLRNYLDQKSKDIGIKFIEDIISQNKKIIETNQEILTETFCKDLINSSVSDYSFLIQNQINLVKLSGILTKDELLQEYKKINSSKEDTEDLFKIFDEAFNLLYGDKKNSGAFYSFSKILTNQKKTIDLWNNEDVKTWSKKMKKVFGSSTNFVQKKEYFIESLAVIIQACYQLYGYYPRNSQLLAIMNCFIKDLSEDKHDSSIMLEIKTGEGKTLTTAINAIIHVLQGSNVDILTSNDELAVRDAAKAKQIYSLFDITVSANLSSIDDRYTKDIVYGEVASFVGDVLHQEHFLIKTRDEREHLVLLVDESDSICLDNVSSLIRFSNAVPTIEFFVPLLMKVSQAFDIINKNMFQALNQHDIDEGEKNLFMQKAYEQLLEITVEEVEMALSNYQDMLPIHLREWGNNKKYDFAEALIQSYQMQQKVEYIISKTKDSSGVKKEKIVPIDLYNTGIIQHNTQLTDIQQFLEIKEKLEVTAPSFITVFMSYLSFLQRYEGNIYGMSGTLGSENTRNIYKHLYKMESYNIPRFSTSLFEIKPPVIAPDEESWKNYIIKRAVEVSDLQNRVALVIVKSIKDVETLQQGLILARNSTSSSYEIITYSQGEITEEALQNLGAHKIILATNLAGRGTDITTTKEVELNGGVHVILGYFSFNLRVEEQALGRTARAGNKGSGEIVINESTLNIEENFSDKEKLYNYLLEVRKNQELYDLETKFWQVGISELQDSLFVYFNKNIFHGTIKLPGENIIRNFLNKDKKNKVNIELMQDQIREFFGKWLDGKDFQRILEESLRISKKIYSENLKFVDQDIKIKIQNLNINKSMPKYDFEHLELNQETIKIFQKVLGIFTKILTEELKSDFDKKEAVFSNPSLLTGMALNSFSESKSEELFKKASELDSAHCAPAQYNFARFKINKNAENHKRNESNLHEELQSLLSNSNAKLQDINQVFFKGAMTMQFANDSNIYKQISQFYKAFEAIISHTSSKIQEIKDLKQTPSKILALSLSKSSIEDFLSQKGIDKQIIDTIKRLGFPEILEIRTIDAEVDWESAIKLIAIGAIKIGIGCLLTSIPAFYSVGKDFIMGGMKTIYEGIKIVFVEAGQEAFDFEKFFQGEAKELLFNLISFGMSKMKEIWDGVKAGKDLITSAKNVGSNLVKEINQGLAKDFTKNISSKLAQDLAKDIVFVSSTKLLSFAVSEGLSGSSIADETISSLMKRVSGKLSNLKKEISDIAKNYTLAGKDFLGDVLNDVSKAIEKITDKDGYIIDTSRVINDIESNFFSKGTTKFLASATTNLATSLSTSGYDIDIENILEKIIKEKHKNLDNLKTIVKKLLKNKLKHLGLEDCEELINILEKQGLFEQGSFKYETSQNIDLGKYNKHKKYIEEVLKIVNQINEAEFKDNVEKQCELLEENVKKIVEGRFKSYINNGVSKWSNKALHNLDNIAQTGKDLKELVKNLEEEINNSDNAIKKGKEEGINIKDAEINLGELNKAHAEAKAVLNSKKPIVNKLLDKSAVLDKKSNIINKLNVSSQERLKITQQLEEKRIYDEKNIKLIEIKVQDDKIKSENLENNKELPEGKKLDISKFKIDKTINGKTETLVATAYNNALSSAQNAHNKEQPSNSNKEQSSTSNNEDSRIGRIKNHISDSSIEGFGNSLLRLVQDIQDSLVSKDDKELNIMQETFQNKLDAGELYNIVSMDGACSDFAVEVLTKIVKERNKELLEGKELDISNFNMISNENNSASIGPNLKDIVDNITSQKARQENLKKEAIEKLISQNEESRKKFENSILEQREAALLYRMDNNYLINQIYKGFIHDTLYDIKPTDPMPGFEAFSGKKKGDEFCSKNGIKHRIVHADKNAKFSFTIYYRKDTLHVDNNDLIYQSKFSTGHIWIESTNLQTGETIRKALHPKGMLYLISKIDPNPELKDTHQINLLLQTGRGDKIEGITILSKDDKELNIMQKIFQEKINNGKLYNILSKNGACSDFAVEVLTKIVIEKNKELPENAQLKMSNFKIAKTETFAETAYNNALSSAQNAHNEEQSNTSNNTDSMIGRVTNHISDSSYEGLVNSILRFFQVNLVTLAKKNGKTETFAEKTAYNNALSSAQNAHNEEQSDTSNNTDSMIGRVTNHISDFRSEEFGNSVLRFVQDNLVTFNSANTVISNSANTVISNSANIYHSKEDSQDPTSDLALIGENGENH